MFSRRKFLGKVGAGGATAAGLAGPTAPAHGSSRAFDPKRNLRSSSSPPATAMVAPAVAGLNLNVTEVGRTLVDIPFRPVPARRMMGENYDYRDFIIYKVTLACGVVGFGEV